MIAKGSTLLCSGTGERCVIDYVHAGEAHGVKLKKNGKPRSRRFWPNLVVLRLDEIGEWWNHEND